MRSTVKCKGRFIMVGIVSHFMKIIRCSECFAYPYNNQQMVISCCHTNTKIGVTLQSTKCIVSYKDGCHRLQHLTHMNSVLYSVTIILNHNPGLRHEHWMQNMLTQTHSSLQRIYSVYFYLMLQHFIAL